MSRKKRCFDPELRYNGYHQHMSVRKLEEELFPDSERRPIKKARKFNPRKKKRDGCKSAHRDNKMRSHCNRHHNINKCNGGTMNFRNLIWTDCRRHKKWHDSFENMSIPEVIAFLETWPDLFHKMSVPEAIEFLKRLVRAKGNQTTIAEGRDFE